MSQSRIPSPARSQGAPITPRRYKSRTRSVGSPARSTTSVRLSALAQFKENNKDSFVLSPAPSRRSVLNDDTDIEEPRRRSWWRKLNDNSRDVMEVLNDNKVLETNEAVEEYIDIEVLSQEKQNYTLDLPDSSDSESISSIVIAQRKLFTQKDQAQNKFGQLIGTRETLAKLHKSTAADKTVNVPPKNLFGHGTRPKSKPVFPAALLNLSSNKTVNKTKENVAAEVKGQVKSLFGNRAGTKRKNMFADFIVSESEDEISEIQPKVFGFPKKPDTRRDSATSRGKREHSPTSSITTDIEMEEWKMLPSSTMVENQLEDMMAAAKTPVKRPRLSKLPDIKETETKSTVEQIEKEPSDEEQELKYDDEDDKSEANDEQQMQDQHEVDDNEHDSIQNNISAQQNKSHATSQSLSKVKDKNVNQSKIPSVNQQNNVSQHKMSPEKKQDVEMEVELTQKQDNNTVVKNKSHRDSNALQKEKAEESKTQKNDDINVDQVDNREEGNDQNKSKNNRNVSVNQNKDQVKSNASQEKGNDKEAIAANASDNLDQDEQEELNENVDEEIQEENEDQIQNDIEEQESESKEPENDSEEQNEDVELQNQSEIIEQDEDNEVSMAQESETEQNKDEMDVQNDSLVQNHEDSETNAQNESAAQDHNESAPEIQSEQEEEAQDSEQEDEENQEENQVENESSAEDQDNEVENQSEIEDDDDRNASDAEMEQDSAVQDENEDGNNESAEVQNDEDAEENESDNEQNDDEEEVNETAEVNDSEEDQNESAEVNEMEDQNESAEVNDTEEDQDESDQVNDTEEDQNESAEVQNDDEEDEQNESAEMDNDLDDDAQNESVQQESEDEIQDSNDQQQSDNEAPNETHDTTGRHRKKKDTNVNSPEAILHDKTNQLESFTAQGRNTSVRKTTMLKNMTIRPSLAPPRESTGISDGTTNSSAEGSGWDSHRTTRKTLRQTFGRDFTPRKSLRALVMEKSAKRQTAISEVTAKFPQANSTELQLPEASMVPDDCEMTVEEDRQESNHDVSKRTRQTTLEMYLQKIKKQNMERNLKMQEAVRNSLKAPTTDVLNPFKVPARPMFSSRKPNKAASKPKAKPVKSALIPLGDLPPELLEDMKYKPPKRFQPSNASWITKRLYKFLESKLESKYDYKARVRAEKLVQTIYHFAKDLRRVPVAPAPAVDALKLEMARLGVVTTHFDFYQFFHEYMPREVRIKVVPDIVNKISVPRHGVFSDIIRGNTVQG
ncbi:FK506-binding protein 5-like [Ostrinia furnacalis]|uniref:FK506-binding protein 5-like n=1 Tax=Ostrinia furnacalis TaxID=93504 RepID=UPI001040C251|nr:FK506-binding protein 5-like [Ostrinia furnacalis]